MSLIPVLRLVSLDDESASIVVVDATGAYNVSTNPGGYGSPNPASAAITSIILQLASFRDLTSYTPYLLEDTTDILDEGYTFTPAAGSFLDGVYDMKYDVCTNLGAITITPNAKTFTLANADTVLAGVSGIILTNEDDDKVYYIDTTRALTSSGGYVTEAFPAAAEAVQAASQKVYESNLKFLVANTGNDCLLADIAVWSDMSCDGIDFRDISKRYIMKLAMETKFTQELLLDAHNLSVKLAAYCSEDNTNCGC